MNRSRHAWQSVGKEVCSKSEYFFNKNQLSIFSRVAHNMKKERLRNFLCQKRPMHQFKHIECAKLHVENCFKAYF